MKALHLNLASRPYRDYRPVYAVIVVMSLLIAILGLNNVDTLLRYRSQTKNTRAQIAQLEAQAAEEKSHADQATQRLRGVNLLALNKQTQFVNTQLAERAFSWSELLDRLERVLPDNVRIASISPSFDKSGIVHLSLNCEGKDGNAMVATIDHLNKDSHFSNPFPSNEDNTGSGFRFALSVDYRPSVARVVQ